MRVASKHLTTVSKVFEALLGPHFQEGQTQHDASNPLELPDDHPEATELMCKLAHHKVTTILDIEARELPGLTVVCDRYDCTGYFEIHVKGVLEKWLEKVEKLGSNSYRRFQKVCASAV